MILLGSSQPSSKRFPKIRNQVNGSWDFTPLPKYRFMVPGTVPGSRRNRRETPGYPESDWKGLFLGNSRAVPATQNVLEGSREASENGLKGDGRDSHRKSDQATLAENFEPTILKDFVEMWCDRFCAAGEPEFR